MPTTTTSLYIGLGTYVSYDRLKYLTLHDKEKIIKTAAIVSPPPPRFASQLDK